MCPISLLLCSSVLLYGRTAAECNTMHWLGKQPYRTRVLSLFEVKYREKMRIFCLPPQGFSGVRCRAKPGLATATCELGTKALLQLQQRQLPRGHGNAAGGGPGKAGCSRGPERERDRKAEPASGPRLPAAPVCPKEEPRPGPPLALTPPCALPTVPGLCGPCCGSGLEVIWCEASVMA